MAELHLLGIRQTHHRCRVEAPTNLLSSRQRLVGRRGNQCRLVILDGDAAGELQVCLVLANDARLFGSVAFGLGGRSVIVVDRQRRPQRGLPGGFARRVAGRVYRAVYSYVIGESS